jgi:hypothetical protein
LKKLLILFTSLLIKSLEIMSFFIKILNTQFAAISFSLSLFMPSLSRLFLCRIALDRTCDFVKLFLLSLLQLSTVISE